VGTSRDSKWEAASPIPAERRSAVIDERRLTRPSPRPSPPSSRTVGVNWNSRRSPTWGKLVAGEHGERRGAFGSDAALVALHVGAYVRGTPGATRCGLRQGTSRTRTRTEQDSHLEMPTVTGEVEAGMKRYALRCCGRADGDDGITCASRT